MPKMTNPHERMTTVVRTRLRDADYAAVNDFAKRNDLTVADLVRRCLFSVVGVSTRSGSAAHK